MRRQLHYFTPRALRAGLVVALCAPLMATVVAQTGDKAPAGIAEARSRLAASQSPAEYASLLDSLSAALPPTDALALLDEGLPTVEAGSAGSAASTGLESRRTLVVRAGDLALLLGLFAESSRRYAEASALLPAGAPEGDALLLRAARSSLAAGDAEGAQALSSGLKFRSADPALSAAARLVEAWAAALQGRLEEARNLAAAVVALPDRAREARFILWLCADGTEKAAAAAALAAQFPGSPEALIASGAGSPPPLPHWYLGGLGGQTVVKPAAGPVEKPAGTVTKGAPPPAAPASRDRRLQVGYFSVEENARALKEELVSKGFPATVEPRLRAAGSGKGGEKRWIVAVPEGKDIAATMQSLKDAGYESYVLE